MTKIVQFPNSSVRDFNKQDEFLDRLLDALEMFSTFSKFDHFTFKENNEEHHRYFFIAEYVGKNKKSIVKIDFIPKGKFQVSAEVVVKNKRDLSCKNKIALLKTLFECCGELHPSLVFVQTPHWANEWDVLF
ncbi:hypothetical protein Q4575_05525 [Psychrosphaera sp. 1_MG-2023]|uniref:hypothetical protein n=1 Tax=Psychrosphaera sp. 1_MG-2023 TaxID=3062643 RepID=UPI0026E22537|nr:hypothetical protein [Psychrosphaera sp. 1_MG-2023]MDO6718851.1 hypothetical protein [Psychrosphaera sp. 1_MG-2023]